MFVFQISANHLTAPTFIPNVHLCNKNLHNIIPSTTQPILCLPPRRMRYCLQRGALSVGKRHRKLGSMEKTQRRLSDARERICVRCAILFLFFAYFPSLFFCSFFAFNFCVGACFLLSVPVPTLFFCFGLPFSCLSCLFPVAIAYLEWFITK